MISIDNLPTVRGQLKIHKQHNPMRIINIKICIVDISLTPIIIHYKELYQQETTELIKIIGEQDGDSGSEEDDEKKSLLPAITVMSIHYQQ